MVVTVLMAHHTAFPKETILAPWLVAFRLEDGQRCHINQQDDTRDGEYQNAASNGIANGFLQHSDKDNQPQ
jgi:hypothetical protein